MKDSLLSSLCFLVLLTVCAHATLIGESVTGSLTFNGGSTNFFSPSNGFVPGGFGNSAPGTNTVTVGGGVEFAFSDAANRDTADFGSNTLFIQDISAGSGSSPFIMTFTSSGFLAYSGLVLSGDTFGLTYSFSGDTLSINSPRALGSPTRSATFTFASGSAVPDTGSTALLTALAVLSLLGAGRISRGATLAV